jgi:hypothetical protein
LRGAVVPAWKDALERSPSAIPLFEWPKSKLEFFHARRARGMRVEKGSSHYRFKHFQCTADNLSSELALELLAACMLLS